MGTEINRYWLWRGPAPRNPEAGGEMFNEMIDMYETFDVAVEQLMIEVEMYLWLVTKQGHSDAEALRRCGCTVS